MSAVAVVLWFGALAFCAFLAVGYSRWFRWVAEKDNDILGPLLVGGMGFVGLCAGVLASTYSLIVEVTS